MPVISRFHGLTVMMYQRGKEHNPPHVHIKDNEGHWGVFSLNGLLLSDTDLSPKEVSDARDWISLHTAELNTMWDTQDFVKLAPLE
ncbi:MAG: DUF4160 domain-containing protein [Clostridia bacterium]|nr:DUF4160 domain-containing protein [Clostridia bacterium]